MAPAPFTTANTRATISQVNTLSYEVEQEWGSLEQILGATASQTHGSGSGIDSPHAYWLLSRVPVASSLGVDR